MLHICSKILQGLPFSLATDIETLQSTHELVSCFLSCSVYFSPSWPLFFIHTDIFLPRVGLDIRQTKCTCCSSFLGLELPSLVTCPIYYLLILSFKHHLFIDAYFDAYKITTTQYSSLHHIFVTPLTGTPTLLSFSNRTNYHPIYFLCYV